MEELKKQYLEFIASPVRNVWLMSTVGQIYVRKSRRMFPQVGFADAIDIANVEIAAEHRRTGVLTEFFHFMRNQHPPEMYFFVENVSNKDMADWCTKLGLTRMPQPSSWGRNFDSFYMENNDGRSKAL